MRKAKSIPRQWLMTDERLGGKDRGDALWRAVARLPIGGGIVVRHHGWPKEERRALARQLQKVAQRRRLTLIVAGISGFDGLHWHRGAPRHQAPLITASAHSARELHSAFRAGADVVFLSPVFATSTHPGARTLGATGFGLTRRGARGKVVALGGMNAKRDRHLRTAGAHGFAAISAWLRR